MTAQILPASAKKEAGTRQKNVVQDNLIKLALFRHRRGASDEISRLIGFLHKVQQNGNYHLFLAVKQLIRQCECGLLQQAEFESQIR